MKNGIVILFPGTGGDEIPLLYFCGKVFQDKGYDKQFISSPVSGEKSFEALYLNAKKHLEAANLSQYETVIFIAKSVGTEIAGGLKEELKIKASLILLTPLEETLPFIKHGNDILLVAAGDKDKYLDTQRLQELCKKEEVPFYIEKGVGHRMEVKDDLVRNLEVIKNVVEKL